MRTLALALAPSIPPRTLEPSPVLPVVLAWAKRRTPAHTASTGHGFVYSTLDLILAFALPRSRTARTSVPQWAARVYRPRIDLAPHTPHSLCLALATCSLLFASRSPPPSSPSLILHPSRSSPSIQPSSAPAPASGARLRLPAYAPALAFSVRSSCVFRYISHRYRDHSFLPPPVRALTALGHRTFCCSFGWTRDACLLIRMYICRRRDRLPYQ